MATRPVPAHVGRFFKPVATIGPALFIASRFAISFLLQSAREHLPSFVQSPDKATVAERRTDEKTAVDLLETATSDSSSTTPANGCRRTNVTFT